MNTEKSNTRSIKEYSEYIGIFLSIASLIAYFAFIPNTFFYFYKRNYYAQVHIPNEYIQVSLPDYALFFVVSCMVIVIVISNIFILGLLIDHHMRLRSFFIYLAVLAVIVFVLLAVWGHANLLWIFIHDIQTNSLHDLLKTFLDCCLLVVLCNGYVIAEGISKKIFSHCHKGNRKKSPKTSENPYHLSFLIKQLLKTPIHHILLYILIVLIVAIFMFAYTGKQDGENRCAFKVYTTSVTAADSEADNHEITESQTHYPIVFENSEIYVLADFKRDAENRVTGIDYSYYKEIPKENAETYYYEEIKGLIME